MSQDNKDLDSFNTAKTISERADDLLKKRQALGEYDVNAADIIEMVAMIKALAEITRRRLAK
jgi:hypothetical protein